MRDSLFLIEVFHIKNFIMNYSLKNIKFKLLILYMLNIMDIIFTLLLLNTGFYREGNFLMLKVVQNTSVSLLLKIILPAVLLIIIYSRMKKAADYQLKISNYFINGITIFYVLINVLHFVYCALLPVFIKLYS